MSQNGTARINARRFPCGLFHLSVKGGNVTIASTDISGAVRGATGRKGYGSKEISGDSIKGGIYRSENTKGDNAPGRDGSADRET